MPATVTTANAILKQVYPRMLKDQLVVNTPILSYMRRVDRETWEGRESPGSSGMEWPLRVGRNEGHGFGRIRGPIAEAGNQAYVSMHVPNRYWWGRINVDGPSMKITKSGRSYFAKILQQEMEGLSEAQTRYMNIVSWGYGSGVLCLVDGTISTTALTVDLPGNVTTAGGATVENQNGARFLNKGMTIAVLTPATGAAVTGVFRIASVGTTTTAFDTATTTVAGTSVTAIDDGLVVRAPNLSVTDVNDTSFNREPMGMLGHIDDGTYVPTYMGISRTTYDVLQANVINLNAALNLDTMQQGIDVASQRGGGKIRVIWCEHSTRRAYLALLVANRRYISSGGTNNHDGGFAGQAITVDPEFSGIPIMVDQDCPYGTMFFMDPRDFIYFANTEFEWIEDDHNGSILHMTPGVDEFEAYGRWFGNFACDRPNRNVRIDDILTNVAIAHVA